jgi:4'-phosphopantetheinyl transferase EntD
MTPSQLLLPTLVLGSGVRVIAGVRHAVAPMVSARTAPVFSRLFEANLRHGFCIGVLLPADAAPAGTSAVRAGAGVLGSSAPDVTPHPLELREATEMGSDARFASFCGGRAALHAAMRACGIDGAGPIPRHASGAPVLPAGMLGSISHTRGLAASIVRPATPGVLEAVGLDVELVSRACSPRLAARVLTARERSQTAVEAASGSPEQAGVLLRFSLKEALYKALHQVDAHTGVAFRDLSLSPRLDGSALCDWTAPERRVARDWDVSLTWTVLGGFFVTTAHVRRAERR